MVDWRRLFGRSPSGPDRTPPAQPLQPDLAASGPPRLDPPDVTAARVARKAAEARAEWAALLSRQPDVEERRITRPMLNAALRAAGYRSRRIDGETVFVKSLSDRSFGIVPVLKTTTGSRQYAPSQRLSLTGFVSLDRAARVERRLLPSHAALPATDYADKIERRAFVLTDEEADSAIAEMDATLSKLDIDAALTRHRAHDPAQPGHAGLQHLVALVLAGDVAPLQAYASERADGGSAGFMPYITDAMIDDALALARLVAAKGPEPLDRHHST